jgi:hypothetical protein
MSTILRSIGAILAAIAVAIALLVAVELYSAVVHPTPPGFGGTHEEICAHVARYPICVLATALTMW